MTTSAYDSFPYPSLPFAASRPARLAAIARGRGLPSPRIAMARVLELGCGAGGNLLPLAELFPQGTFLGIDASEQQIAEGEAARVAIDAPNLSFLAADFSVLEKSSATFDYVICHGVYSWTTAQARRQILELCGNRLAPNGIAYINFNTLPGWYQQAWVRDLLSFATAGTDGPENRIARARNSLDWFADAFGRYDLPLRDAWRQELAQTKKFADPFLFHAYLNFRNEPCLVGDFLREVGQCGLKYLGDADPALTWPALPRELLLSLRQRCRNEIELEQSLDFLRNNSSRRTLLCRQHHELQLEVTDEAWDACQISGKLAEQIGSQDGTHRFRSPAGATITTRDPLTRACLQQINAAWPDSVPFSQLIASTRNATQQPTPSVWRDDLHRLVVAGLLELTCEDVNTPHQRPLVPFATRFARWQANSSNPITNRRHQSVQLNAADRQVLLLLDGTRDELAIAAHTHQSIDAIRTSLARLHDAALLASM